MYVVVESAGGKILETIGCVSLEEGLNFTLNKAVELSNKSIIELRAEIAANEGWTDPDDKGTWIRIYSLKLGRVPTVVVVVDGVVRDHILCTADTVEKVFLDVCKEEFSNFDEYSADDIQTILDNGYETGNNKSVCLTWAVSPN